MGLYINTQTNKYFGADVGGQKLDQILEKYLDFDGGYFVELGANNGTYQSNTLYFERYRNWCGILVEPILHNYFHCKASRSKKTRIFCGACTSFDYKDKFVEIVYSNLMSTPKFLESDILDPELHAINGKIHLGANEEVVSVGAISRTLNSILDEANAPQVVDLLSLDVEGAEIEVLKGINYERYCFKYMCIESRDVSKISNYLISHNYYLEAQLTQHDYLFKNEKFNSKNT